MIKDEPIKFCKGCGISEFKGDEWEGVDWISCAFCDEWLMCPSCHKEETTTRKMLDLHSGSHYVLEYIQESETMLLNQREAYRALEKPRDPQENQEELSLQESSEFFVKYEEEKKITAQLQAEVERVKKLTQKWKQRANKSEEKLTKKKASYKRKLKEKVEKREKKRTKYEDELSARIAAETKLDLYKRSHLTQLKELEVAHKKRVNGLTQEIDRINHVSASRRAATGSRLQASEARNRALESYLARRPRIPEDAPRDPRTRPI